MSNKANMKAREARYQRRIAKKIANNKKRSDATKTLEEAFTRENIYKVGLDCCKGVRWKPSTQNFERTLVMKTEEMYNKIKDGNVTLKPLNHQWINERGKPRYIGAPHINERILYKTVAREFLFPVYLAHLIDTNGACIPHKGFYYTLEMLKKHLRRHFKKNGRMGYIILFDFESFFPNALHSNIEETHKKFIFDDKKREFIDWLMNAYGNDVGLELGIEPSQPEMVMYPYQLDGYIRCQLHIPLSGHYMDDNWVIPNIDQDPYKVRDKILAKAESLGLKINKAKTKVVPLDQPFTFCKARFMLTETGKVVMKCNKKNITRARRKIISLAKKYNAMKDGTSDEYILGEDIMNALRPSLAYFDHYDAHNTKMALRRLIYAKFGKSIDDLDAWRDGDLETQLEYGLISQRYYDFLKYGWDGKPTDMIPQTITDEQGGSAEQMRLDI